MLKSLVPCNCMQCWKCKQWEFRTLCQAPKTPKKINKRCLFQYEWILFHMFSLYLLHLIVLSCAGNVLSFIIIYTQQKDFVWSFFPEYEFNDCKKLINTNIFIRWIQFKSCVKSKNQLLRNNHLRILVH